MNSKLARALSRDEACNAYRIGVARGLAELGLTPSVAESLLKCAAEGGISLVPSLYNQVMPWIETAGTGALVAGGAIGAATGHLRHQFERTVADKDDPETEETKKKILGYQKMTRELQTARAAGLSQ